MKINEASFYFIGIGGIGMSALAELMLRIGARVAGSDIKESTQTRHLRSIGVRVFSQHSAENITDADVVVYSSAIQSQNPEVMEARRRKLPIIHRSEALAEIMRYKRGIAIAGTHGKTTTTSMLASIFMDSNLDPTIAVGGRLQLIQSTARLGRGEWMVLEADESDGSFSRLTPEISVITNIDADHLDYFSDFAAIQKAFHDFAMKIPFYGMAVVNGDNPVDRELFKDFPKRITFFGFDAQNDYQICAVNDGYKICRQHREIGWFQLQIPGDHNALNALAAIIAANYAGVPWDQCLTGVSNFSGVDRRFQYIGEANGVTVYDDYAHHPTEIKATLKGARQKFADKKINVVFQPHRYTRTRDCWQDYLESFREADQLFLLDVYPAGEEPIPGVDSQRLAALMPTNCTYCDGFPSLLDDLGKKVGPGEIVMTMGAGSVNQCAVMILEKLQS